jgi:hypothetical protein
MNGYVAFEQHLQDDLARERSETRGAQRSPAAGRRPDFVAARDWIGPLVLTPLPTNVATYLGRIGRDFGLAGRLVVPFLMGLGSP